MIKDKEKFDEYANIVASERDFKKRRNKYFDYERKIKDEYGYEAVKEFDILCDRRLNGQCLREQPNDFPIHNNEHNMSAVQINTANEIIESIMKNIKAVLTEINKDEYIALKHETTNIADEILISKWNDIDQSDKTAWADLTAVIFGRIIKSDCFAIIFCKYEIILANPLREVIPDTVWNDLEYKDKVKIINAIKTGKVVTYFHTDRKDSRRFTEDTDIIGIDLDADKNSFKIEEKSLSGILSKTGEMKMILSRATAERGIVKIENPVPEIIPCDVWNNLPDVAKEEFVEKTEKGKIFIENCKQRDREKLDNPYYDPPFFEVIYHPMKEKNNKPFGMIDENIEKDIIEISSGQFGVCGPLSGGSNTVYYDAKNGFSLGGVMTIS
jgi:hypothetical protein